MLSHVKFILIFLLLGAAREYRKVKMNTNFFFKPIITLGSVEVGPCVRLELPQAQVNYQILVVLGVEGSRLNIYPYIYVISYGNSERESVKALTERAR